MTPTPETRERVRALLENLAVGFFIATGLMVAAGIWFDETRFLAIAVLTIMMWWACGGAARDSRKREESDHD